MGLVMGFATEKDSTQTSQQETIARTGLQIFFKIGGPK